MFAGYSSFRRAARLEPWLRILPRVAVRLAAQGRGVLGSRYAKLEALDSHSSPTEKLYAGTRGLFSPSQIRKLLKSEVLSGHPCRPWDGPLLVPPHQELGPVRETMALELRCYTHDQLLRDGDVFGLAHALEIRVPLIDEHLTRLLFQVDPALLMQGRPKHLLMEALPTALPRICTHRPKMGFTFPFDSWLRGPWKSWAEAQLLALGASGRGWLESKAVESVWRNYLGGRVHWSRPWSLIALGRYGL